MMPKPMVESDGTKFLNELISTTLFKIIIRKINKKSPKRKDWRKKKVKFQTR